MIHRLGACHLLCLTVLSTCAAHGEVDESALFQKGLQLHKIIDASAKARLLDRLLKDETIVGYFQEIASLEENAQRFILQHATDAASRAAPTSSALLEFRQLPGVGGVGPGSMSGGSLKMQMGPEQMEAFEEVLDALDSDDFIRNFTAMQGSLEELANWFNVTSVGLMDLYLEAAENSSKEEFTIELEHFLRSWQHLELDFFTQMMDLEAGLARNLPRGLFKKDYAGRIGNDIGNFTDFVKALKNVTKPNMTGVDGDVFCPIMVELGKHEKEIKQVMKDSKKAVDEGKKILPMIGKSFSQLLPEDDVGSLEMTPRLLYTLGLSMNTTGALMLDLGAYQEQLVVKYAPLALKNLGCQEEKGNAEESGAACLHHPVLVVIFSFLSAWLSARVL